MGLTSKIGIATVLTIAAVGAATALATSGGDARIKATEFHLDDGDIGEEVFRCGGSKRALGGGVVQSGTLRRHYLEASGPLDSTGVTLETDDGDVPKQWYTAETNYDEDVKTVRAYAICAKAPDATIEANTFTGDVGQTVEAEAECPGSKRAIGGGVLQSGPPDGLFVNASGPLGASGVTTETDDGDTAREWYAAIDVGTTGGNGRVFKAFAICSEASKARIEATTITIDDHDKQGASAECPGRSAY